MSATAQCTGTWHTTGSGLVSHYPTLPGPGRLCL